MSEDISDENLDILSYLDGEYPEATFYYIFGKLFRWTPKVVDELDLELCFTLLKMERDTIKYMSKGLDEDDEDEKSSKSFPKEWETMSVKDILDSEEFKKRAEQDHQMMESMFNRHKVK